MDINELMVNEPKKAFKKMSVPLIAFAVFDAIYSLIDLAWAGGLGHNAVAAVGVATPLFVLIGTFGSTIGQGTNSLMSRFLGINEYKKVNNVMMHGFLMCVIVSILLPLIEIPFLEPLLIFMNFKTNASLVISYLVPLLVCSFIFIFNEYFPETLQAEGETRKPTIFLIAGSILNLILDPIFAFYFGLGIVGLACATIISSLLPLGLFIYLYFVKKGFVPVKLTNFHFKTKFVKEIFKVTVPNFLDRSTFTVLGTYINLVLSFVGGPIAISIYSLANQIKDLMLSPSRGAARSTLSITGHLLGANKHSDLKSFYYYGIKMASILAVISSIVLVLFHSTIISYFSHIAEFVGIWYVVSLVIICLFTPISLVSGKVLDGIGLSVFSFMGSILRVGLIIVFIYYFESTFNMYGLGVILSIALSEVIIAIIYIILLNIIFRYKIKNSNLIETVE